LGPLVESFLPLSARKKKIFDPPATSRGHGVWVPAFAGTTSARSLFHKKQTPERLPSPVSEFVLANDVIAPISSERTQQNGSNEREHGKDRHHIEIQCCKAHVGAPFLVERSASLTETRANPKREMYCSAAKHAARFADGQKPVTNMMIFRDKRFAVTSHKQTK
jgi:hypothetical protein